MDGLIDQARDFIEHSTPEKLYFVLSQCVESGGAEALAAVQLLARDMYGGMADNYFVKAPAAFCLLAWGELGIRAIVENVSLEDSFKNHLLVVNMLAPISGGDLPIVSGFLNPEIFSSVKKKIGDSKQFQQMAKKLLNQYVMSLKDPDDIALYLGTSLQQLSLNSAKAIKPMAQALALRYSTIGLSELDEFEKLVETKPNDEPTFHSFFEHNPLFLDPLALRVWSKPDLHGHKEPDFLIQRADNSYVVVEIETPKKILVTNQNQFSADTTHAITQVIGYRSFLSERLQTVSATFPNFSSPNCLVVIGLESKLSNRQKETLRLENEHRSYVTIMGFDELGRRSRSITENLIDSNITAERVRLK